MMDQTVVIHSGGDGGGTGQTASGAMAPWCELTGVMPSMCQGPPLRVRIGSKESGDEGDSHPRQVEVRGSV
jgi:hypothetical protein